MAAKAAGAAVPAVTGGGNGANLPIATMDDLANYEFINDNALDIIRENLGGQELSPSDFERITFPAGGAQSWELAGLDGEPETVKTIDGVVLMYKTSRAYWENEFTGAGSPPDCRSNDLQFGQGNPGGSCATCPYSQWESDSKGGGGQACKLNGALFVMKPGELLPVIVPVPVASVKIVKAFFLNLVSKKKLKYTDVILSIGLKATQNKKGIKYSELNPKLIAVLPDLAKQQIGKYIGKFGGAMHAASIAREDIPDAE